MAMYIVPDCETKQYATNGEDVRREMILATTTPATLPLTGENVEGLADTAKLGNGSVLMDLQASKKYVLCADNWFEWTN